MNLVRISSNLLILGRNHGIMNSNAKSNNKSADWGLECNEADICPGYMAQAEINVRFGG
jgi:hypothetical protein